MSSSSVVPVIGRPAIACLSLLFTTLVSRSVSDIVNHAPILPSSVRILKLSSIPTILNAQAGDEAHVSGLIEGSEKVQEEDMGLCAEVQLGLASPAYDIGR